MKQLFSRKVSFTTGVSSIDNVQHFVGKSSTLKAISFGTKNFDTTLGLIKNIRLAKKLTSNRKSTFFELRQND